MLSTQYAEEEEFRPYLRVSRLISIDLGYDERNHNLCMKQLPLALDVQEHENICIVTYPNAESLIVTCDGVTRDPARFVRSACHLGSPRKQAAKQPVERKVKPLRYDLRAFCRR